MRMNKIKKQFITFTIIIAMLIGCIPIISDSAYATNIILSGRFNPYTDATYKLDLDNYEFTISGSTETGVSYAFVDGHAGQRPWDSYIPYIHTVTINKNINYIGGAYFAHCTNLTNVKIPSTVDHIGHHSFYGTSSLTSINIPEGVTRILDGAFANSGLTSITLPASVTKIDDTTFNGCSSNLTIYAPANSYAIDYAKRIGLRYQTITPIPSSTNIADYKPALNYTTTRYNGSATTPTVIIDGLINGKDYTVTYSNNINAGIATAMVTGIGNYTGSKILNYTITKSDISSLRIKNNAAYIYDGTAKTLLINMYDPISKVAMIEGVDYTAVYSKNINAGTAVATIIGIGNYTGSCVVNFPISPKNINSFIYRKNINTSWDTAGNLILSISKLNVSDYSWSWDYDANNSLNVNVTITGKGNYTGTKVITIKSWIRTMFATKTSTLRGTRYKTYNRLSWSKPFDDSMIEYRVYRSTSRYGNYKRIGRSWVDTRYFKDRTAKTGKVYYYKVRAFQNFVVEDANGDLIQTPTLYTAYSNVIRIKTK